MSNLEGSSTATPMASSNIGFQLLKKHGWKEGTGLGVSEQGRLEPVQAYLKKNKRGLGAETKKPQSTGDRKNVASDKTNDKLSSRSRAKRSKKLKKALEIEKKLQENEFQAAFFREFWPDNV
ncbi:hypothetical protein L6452_09851 [Arctium lappa]|uniref:Uncharacterized protein n=1 Tax=Arctium lappa TaxID=4217 RepID=A0ACB9DLM6_ARCLA|nr:hypothetical protein L6452_09851 [Arctium lappa]